MQQRRLKIPEFGEEIEWRLAEVAVSMITKVAVAAQNGNVNVAMWWLERRLPAEFGRRQELHVGAQSSY
jgi:hypothetical protein